MSFFCKYRLILLGLTAFMAALVPMELFAAIKGSTDNPELEQLRVGFRTPPVSSMPRTWWHWLNGNISKDGITADLEAMNCVGIHEAQIFNVDLKYPDGGVKYLSPEWFDCFEHAVKEADRLGMTLSFHNTAGWSSSGGPWISPEYAMQTVVFADTIIDGGMPVSVNLKQPVSRKGYYRDIAIIAFPTPAEDIRIPDIERKSLSAQLFRSHIQPEPSVACDSAAIDIEKIIDLTEKVSSGGVLNWDAPTGKWTVLRLGHTPTGAENRPAPKEGRGLECDKMNPRALDMHWTKGVKPIIDKVRPYVGKTLTGCVIDSYEVGCGNWTEAMPKDFKKLRGYAITKWLPVIAGYTVQSSEASERFLWDFRRTISDLISTNYYAHFSDLCHKEGLTFYAEPYTGPFESAQIGRSADVVMGEFWSSNTFMHSPRLAASIAHLQGKKIIGAEAFTDGYGRWLAHPRYLKNSGDYAWTEGVNRLVFHAYTHQPWNIFPGITMSRYGIDFNRNTSWWEKSRPYMDYISRSQFLLQQGHQVADILVFTGESSPNDGMMRPDIKALGHDYDLAGPDALATLKAKDGWAVAPSGNCYRMIMLLPDTKWMTPQTLKKLHELARNGVVVMGTEPVKSPSLRNYPGCDEDVTETAGKLWRENAAIPNSRLVSVLDSIGLYPDFSVGLAGKNLRFVHRRTPQADIYFIANSEKTKKNLVARFRVQNRKPQLWHPVTGEIRDIEVWNQNGEMTAVPLSFEKEESYFIVFTDNEGGRPANLHIDSSFAGEDLPLGMMDVSDFVRLRVKEKRFSVSVNNKTLPADPAPGSVKELRVSYRTDKGRYLTKATEGSTLKLVSNEGPVEILGAYYGKFPYDMEGIPEGAVSYSLDNGWTLSIADEKPLKLDKLKSWSEMKNDDIRFFSGTATYSRQFKVEDEYLDDCDLWLDLGDVEVIAEVLVNGNPVETLWCYPYRANLKGFVKQGENTLEIRVTNLPVNRMIGEERFPDDIERNGQLVKAWPDWLVNGAQRTSGRSTIATWKHYDANAPLVKSGLVGPVYITPIKD